MQTSGRVTKSYQVAYPNPLRLRSGQSVTIERWETNPDWLGWAFCSDENGNHGWISQSYFVQRGQSASMLRDYDATELEVETGEAVCILREELGWAWVVNSSGRQGWIPAENLSQIEAGFELRDGYCQNLNLHQPRLETTRLILEPYSKRDLEDVFAYASHPEVTRWLSWPNHKTLVDSENFLNWVTTITSSEIGKLFFVFAIRLKESGRVIGSIDFKNPQPWIGQLDYALKYDQWGKDLMTEAASAIRDWAFEACPELVRLQSFCEPENKGSSRVMEKIGMQFEGIRRKSFRVGDRLVDLAHYALLRNES